MAIDTINPSLNKYLPDMELIRTIIEGDRALKAKGETYVPRLSGNTNDEYKAYVTRPSFENYTARVLDGLVGMSFAKDPIAKVPTAMDAIKEDVSLSDLSLDDLVTELVREVLTVGRCGVLIDMPQSPSEQLTKAQVEAMNIRPYAKIYKSESIINWRYKLINNVQTTDMIILCEQYEEWEDDYTQEIETIYRVLIMREGVYNQEVWEKGERGFELKEVFTPIMSGKTMNFIPFISVTPDKLTLNPVKPPMLDLATVNLSHFKLLVDFYHGAHFTALPTANFFVGNIPKETTIRLGASTANVFSDPSGHAEYLEFQGSGLTTLSTEKDVLVNRMASLGARFLADDKKVAETTESQETRSSGERAILISAVTTISSGVTRMLQIMAQWMNVSGDISYQLNKDYNLKTIDAQFMKELITGVQTGDITPKILYDNLVAGEVIADPETYTYEEYKKDKEAMQSNMTFAPTPQ